MSPIRVVLRTSPPQSRRHTNSGPPSQSSAPSFPTTVHLPSLSLFLPESSSTGPHTLPPLTSPWRPPKPAAPLLAGWPSDGPPTHRWWAAMPSSGTFQATAWRRTSLRTRLSRGSRRRVSWPPTATAQRRRPRALSYGAKQHTLARKMVTSSHAGPDQAF